MIAVKNWRRFAALTALVCAVALAGCGKKDDAPKAEGDPKPTPPGSTPPGPAPKQTTPAVAEDLTKAKPEATYTIEAFVAEMTKDYNFPVSKHAGKVIEMTGVVLGYGFGPTAGAFMLKTGPDPLFDRRGEKIQGGQPWTKALPTQTVTLRARVAATNETPNPYPWQFIKAEGPPLPTITAEELAKEREADEKAFNKKYKTAWALLTGTVTDVKIQPDGSATFQLAAGDKKQLACAIPAPGNTPASLTPAQTAALKPGTKVKLLGSPAGDVVTDCIILEPAP